MGGGGLLRANGHIPAAKTGAACDTTLIKPEVSMGLPEVTWESLR